MIASERRNMSFCDRMAAEIVEDRYRKVKEALEKLCQVWGSLSDSLDLSLCKFAAMGVAGWLWCGPLARGLTAAAPALALLVFVVGICCPEMLDLVLDMILPGHWRSFKSFLSDLIDIDPETSACAASLAFRKREEIASRRRLKYLFRLPDTWRPSH
ncbi:hypothetical protein AAG570_000163 [Ranatra chinensis]|uniref:Uncharacterized protein n=1 Tax=Ranatra chinensis TaxID=642074 RepID=A0ABD0YW95_9HEMI